MGLGHLSEKTALRDAAKSMHPNDGAILRSANTWRYWRLPDAATAPEFRLRAFSVVVFGCCTLIACQAKVISHTP
jgi:hypothetical protein